MRIEFLHEPELEFGAGRHIDIKFGLMNYGPFDYGSPLAPKHIKLGIVGTPESVEGVSQWLEKCRLGIPAKPSKRPNLFPRFPGFGEGLPLCADFVLESQLQRRIPQKHFENLCQGAKTDSVLKDLADLFLAELEYLAQKTTIDVFVCAFPFVLVQFLDQADEAGDVGDSVEPEIAGSQALPSQIVFHDYLKAQAMRFRKPTQIIRPGTYDEQKRLKRKHPSGERRKLQDEATRAWNLYAALYYKAGGIPWRLVREATQLDTCYVGISFYHTQDDSKLLTTTAQIFNERGEGMILRGGTARISKDDKQIHLSSEDAYTLLRNSLNVYRQEHRNYPARVVVHKSSVHNMEEIEGFEAALMTCSVDPEQADFVSITRSSTRLFRSGIYPPLRGTLLDMEGEEFVLYTKGSVDFFKTYPGLYVPRPLSFRLDKVAETPKLLAQEILALTKMDWNNTQFDHSEPITLRAARQVGSILKYLENDYEPYYRFYM